MKISSRWTAFFLMAVLLFAWPAASQGKRKQLVEWSLVIHSGEKKFSIVLNKADFEAKLTKFSADAKAAGAKVTDLNSFKAQMGEVGKNCGGCHQTYRKKQS